MKDRRVERLARLLLEYSLGLKKDEIILIQSSPLATPLIKEIYRQALRIGAHPHTQISIDGLSSIFYKNARMHQLKYVSPIKKFIVENVDAFLWIMGAWNTKTLYGVDPQKMAISSRANKDLQKIFMRRERRGELKWTGCLFPTHGSAQDAEMSLDDYEDFVFNGCFCNRADPISAWKKVKKNQARLVRRLNRISRLRIVTKGTDLTVGVRGRRWINCCGTNNMPDGEIFTSPLETITEGKILFDKYPGFYMGQEAEGVYLEFKKGKVVKAKARKGERFLLSMINVDDGARRLGEVSFGTNSKIKRFSRNTLFDEKIGKTMHLALGLALVETGGKNFSSVHWDIVLDMKQGEVYGDGKLIYRNGRFLL
ncbi:MAG TPA: aminopeptidase [bacterium (Candidatus Stahlbacteria)]|nr:aminopeptidase [Candidatus Stahlbacteria bacterium]